MLALTVVFVTAFAAVTVLRTYRAGGDLRSLIPGFSNKTGEFKPEKFTLPEQPPLDLGDVELLSRLNNEYATLTEVVVPSVVSIDTTGVRTERLFDVWGGTQSRNLPTQGQGSGVIVTSEGHVVTNHHVIAGQQRIQVTLHGGKTYTAHLIGEDTLLDIAVLKIDSKETFTPLKMGDSSQVKVGQIVMAIGNPFGLGETVTQGIISAKERSLSDNQRDLFQTDAAINPGNSGGPLVNLRGEIIGINVAIYSPDKQNPGFQGVGFSIPSNDVKDSLFQILERGRPIRGYLGINQVRDVDAMVRSVLQYDGPGGVAVIGILPGSPAQTAGLQYGDIVESVNGEKIRTAQQLISLVQRAKVGQTLGIDIWRKGNTQELKATIAEAGATALAPPLPLDPSAQGRAREPREILQALGIQVRDLSVTERMRGYSGAVVTNLLPSGLAADLLKPGDLIYAVNQSRVSNANEFFLSLAASAAVRDTTLNIVRNGQISKVNLPALPPDE
ncbi:Do family serine endopeptidase [Luteolibacter yonseiensis]